MSIFRDIIDEVPEEFTDSLETAVPEVTDSTEVVVPEIPAEVKLPNVILSKDALANKGLKALNEGEVNIGMKTVVLPSIEDQEAGFALDKESASILVAQYPQYKFIQAKGDTNKQTVLI